MTRLCRAQYEDDDVAEANVVCRLVDNNNDRPNFGSDVDLTNGEAMHADPRDGTMNRLTQKFRTMRLPAWFNFSYSSVPHRAHHAQRRRPNPFGPTVPQRPTFSRLGSLEGQNPDGEEHAPPNVGTVLAMPLQSSPIGEEANPLTTPLISTPSRLVEKHPPTVSWDDDSHIDIPYDNPYYARPISDILWLPRDPFGILDLDDTIDLHVAFTTEPSAGQLGQRVGAKSILPDTSLQLADSPVSVAGPVKPSNDTASVAGTVDDQRSILRPQVTSQYSGQEDIVLRPGIASRVADLENEDDVEQNSRERRPSLFPRISSNKDKDSVAGGSAFRRPRSRKGTMDTERNSQAPSSHMSAFEASQQRGRSTSVATEDPAFKPDMHAQAALLSKDSLAPANFSSSHLRIQGRAENTHQRQVTTQEAVFNEVIAEEQEAAQKRLKEEQADADRAMGKKSWLTSWIYDRTH